MDHCYEPDTLRGYLYCAYRQGISVVQAHKELTIDAGEEPMTLGQAKEFYEDFRKNKKKWKQEMRNTVKEGQSTNWAEIKEIVKKIDSGEWTLKVGQGTSTSS